MIWYFIKFFAEESHADQFMAGELHLNTLAYFKEVESESSDGRMDSTEAVAMWWQPDDLVINLTVLGIGDVEITKKDLAGPVSTSFGYHNYLHLFCLYALHTTGSECVDGKIGCAPEDAEELQRQLKIDERCFKFGKFAVITPAVPFLNQLREALKSQGYKATAQLVEYYDDEVFHGEIPMADIPFRKQSASAISVSSGYAWIHAHSRIPPSPSTSATYRISVRTLPSSPDSSSLSPSLHHKSCGWPRES